MNPTHFDLKPIVEVKGDEIRLLDKADAHQLGHLSALELVNAYERQKTLLPPTRTLFGRKKIIPFEVDYVAGSGELPAAESPVYPLLLSMATEVALTVKEIINECQFLVESANHTNPYADTYIYSIQVLQPLDLASHIKPELLAEIEDQEWASEIRHGMFYHSWLYSRAPRDTFGFILLTVLSHASLLEVNVALSGKERSRKTVRLLQDL